MLLQPLYDELELECVEPGPVHRGGPLLQRRIAFLGFHDLSLELEHEDTPDENSSERFKVMMILVLDRGIPIFKKLQRHKSCSSRAISRRGLKAGVWTEGASEFPVVQDSKDFVVVTAFEHDVVDT